MGESARYQTPDEVAADRAAAEALGGKVCAAAALEAEASCRLLELIGEFDAEESARFFEGCGTTARWLAWACSMAPGTAREHVRVARALRRMPHMTQAFREGRLSYSKIRAVSRLVEAVDAPDGQGMDEAKLCRMALTMTAAQLEATVAGYRSSAGSRLPLEDQRRVSWTDRSGLVSINAALPVEEAAVVIAAIEAALERQPGEDRNPADALLEVARSYLDTVPSDESGEDRTMVVVHVGAETLVASTPPAGDPETVRRDVPAETPTAADVPAETPAATDVSAETPTEEPARDSAPPTREDPPAQTSAAVSAETPTRTTADGNSDRPATSWQEMLRAGTCHIAGVGPIEPATAARLACDATILGAVIDESSDVLALGRTRRLVSKAQRRALMVRDRMCQFPACHRTRHLHAHHVVSWQTGGPTDLDNLVLLCRSHHIAVHEGGITIESATDAGASAPQPRWRFVLPDGEDIADRFDGCADDARLRRLLRDQERRAREQIEQVESTRDPAAHRIMPGWTGEPFSVSECVSALWRMHPWPGPRPESAQLALAS